MSDGPQRANPIADLLMLYSLSQSIGSSLNVYQNCKAFLRTLVARLRLDYAAVWLNHSLLTRSGDATGARLVCSNPKIADLEERLDSDHSLIRKLRSTNRFTWTSADAEFALTPVGAALGEGALTVFGLGNLGALEIFVADPKKQATEEQLEHIAKVVERFTKSVSNCLAYERIRVTENKYRGLFEESRDAVFISTPSGRFLDLNEAGAAMLGYSVAEARKLSIADQVYRDRGDWERYRETVQRYGHVQDYEHVLNHKSGRAVFVLESSSIVRDENGEISAYRGIMRDVTEHRELQQQLSQKQKMESLGLLARGVAHDFNSLLTGILGFAGLMEPLVADNEQVREYLETVLQSAMSAKELTSQLLSFARRGEYNPQPVSLDTLIEGAVGLLDRLLGPQFTIERRLAGDLPTIEADSGQIRQVLLNLCINARDAMPDGGTIVISTRLSAKAPAEIRTGSGAYQRPFVMVEVQDHGVGMTEETLQRIFEPFFTTKGSDRGTGLGLAMVYGVVKHHSGVVQVESTLGEGSCFRVYLPASGKPE